MDWMQHQLANRKTSLAFNDHQTDMFKVNNGLDQSDPFSPICYLIYNANILAIPKTREGKLILLYVDNAAVIVTGKDFMETHNKLKDIME